MQKAPVLKGSGLKPLEDNKTNEEVHVFGKNLEERVVAEDEGESTSISFNSSQNNQNSKEDEDIDTIRKRKFDAITGEEDEETIFQGEFKLFVWDLSTSNWIEKGRGQLKLNDSIDRTEKRSRLIMRVGGTLRILLNVAIKPSFFKVIANTKTNIRFTDSQTVWAASGSNAHQLRELIEDRLEEEKDQLKKRINSDDENDVVQLKKTKAEKSEHSSPSSSPSPPRSSEKEESHQRESHQEGSHQKEDEKDNDDGEEPKSPEKAKVDNKQEESSSSDHSDQAEESDSSVTNGESHQ